MPASVSSAKTNKTNKRKPGRPKLTGNPQIDDPRTRLLKVAVQIFSQYGYDAVSTGDVARAADLSQPMVHYHFGSKEQLWKAAMTFLMRDLGRRFPNDSADLKDLDAVSRLKVITRRFILMSAHDSTLSKIIVHESLADGERLRWLAQSFVKQGFIDFDQAIAEGKSSGQVKGIPTYVVTNAIVSASSFTFCFKALVKLSYEVDISKEERIQEMADGIMEILFNGLLNNEA